MLWETSFGLLEEPEAGREDLLHRDLLDPERAIDDATEEEQQHEGETRGEGDALVELHDGPPSLGRAGSLGGASLALVDAHADGGGFQLSGSRWTWARSSW